MKKTAFNINFAKANIKFKIMKNKNLVLLFVFIILGLLSCQKDDDFTVNSKEELEEKLEAEVLSNNLTSISYCVVKNDKILHSGAKG